MKQLFNKGKECFLIARVHVLQCQKPWTDPGKYQSKIVYFR